MNVKNNKDDEFSVSNEHINDEVKKEDCRTQYGTILFFQNYQISSSTYFVFRNKVSICNSVN